VEVTNKVSISIRHMFGVHKQCRQNNRHILESAMTSEGCNIILQLCVCIFVLLPKYTHTQL